MSEHARHTAHGVWTERAQLDDVIKRLTQQFPELPPEAITKTVRGEYDEFGERKGRDLVPLPVAGSARSDSAHAGRRFRA